MYGTDSNLYANNVTNECNFNGDGNLFMNMSSYYDVVLPRAYEKIVRVSNNYHLVYDDSSYSILRNEYVLYAKCDNAGIVVPLGHTTTKSCSLHGVQVGATTVIFQHDLGRSACAYHVTDDYDFVCDTAAGLAGYIFEFSGKENSPFIVRTQYISQTDTHGHDLQIHVQNGIFLYISQQNSTGRPRISYMNVTDESYVDINIFTTVRCTNFMWFNPRDEFSFDIFYDDDLYFDVFHSESRVPETLPAPTVTLTSPLDNSPVVCPDDSRDSC